MNLKFKIHKKKLPAFGAFTRGTALKGEAKIEIDIDSCALM
jgi:hypothetical protein